MATAPQGFVAAAPPARLVRVNYTTLFHLAALYLGDALLWTAIAAANGLADPWINTQSTIAIPQRVPSAIPPTGLLS